MLAVLCAGAAKGLVQALEPSFAALSGVGIDATFGPVGALRERLLAGARCDAIVLSSALIGRLGHEGHVIPGSAVRLGVVHTGIAVRTGEPALDIHDAAALGSSLSGASRLFFPDPEQSTAGIHFVAVLRRLGIHEEVRDRCATFPNGAAAMHALARSREHDELGCTQVTEINYTQGIALVGALPGEFDLATTYVAAVCAGAHDCASAEAFVRMLGSAETRDLRSRGGFEL